MSLSLNVLVLLNHDPFRTAEVILQTPSGESVIRGYASPCFGRPAKIRLLAAHKNPIVAFVSADSRDSVERIRRTLPGESAHRNFQTVSAKFVAKKRSVHTDSQIEGRGLDEVPHTFACRSAFQHRVLSEGRRSANPALGAR
jgi:hypothetical protein